MNPEIVIIAAVAEENRVIGKGNDLPWHIPEDFKRFKRLTRGWPVVMGRKTFESLLHQNGGPLVERRNVVLSSDPGEWQSLSEVEVYASIDEAMDAVRDADRVFIGGGASVYEHFLTRADRMELTLIEGAYDGDAFFPPFEHLIGSRYRIENVEEHPGFRFVTYTTLASV